MQTLDVVLCGVDCTDSSHRSRQEMSVAVIRRMDWGFHFIEVKETHKMCA